MRIIKSVVDEVELYEMTTESGTHGWKAAAFDLDGTLIQGTTTLLHLADKLGVQREFDQLVRGYESYRLDNKEVSREAAWHFAGYTEAELSSMMEDIPRLEDISPAVALLKRLGIHTVIATITFKFAAAFFATTYGFDGFSGIAVDVDPKGYLTGRIGRHFDEADKANFISSTCNRIGVGTSELIYFGDSRSDLQSFRLAGRSVALNATADARAAADVVVSSNSLVDALRQAGITG